MNPFEFPARPRHILCVSWDPSLAYTREILLTEYGYRVTSALGLEQSKERCSTQADLLLLGHSVPRIEKQYILDCYRQYNHSPALSIIAPGQVRLPDVDFAVETFNPEKLMETIQVILPLHRPE